MVAIDGAVRAALRVLDAAIYGQRPNLLEGTVHGLRSVAFHFQDHNLVATGWIADAEELNAIALERLDAQAAASRLEEGQADWEDMLDLLHRVVDAGL